jgi:hypothetical protein
MLDVLKAAMRGGWKTTEFWVAVLALVLPYMQSYAGHLPGTAGLIAGALISVGYAISRGLVKAQTIATAGPAAASESAYAFANASQGGNLTGAAGLVAQNAAAAEALTRMAASAGHMASRANDSAGGV